MICKFQFTVLFQTSRHALTSKVRFQSWASPCEMYGAQYDTGTGFSY
jgi:hypothetical protein